MISFLILSCKSFTLCVYISPSVSCVYCLIFLGCYGRVLSSVYLCFVLLFLSYLYSLITLINTFCTWIRPSSSPAWQFDLSIHVLLVIFCQLSYYRVIMNITYYFMAEIRLNLSCWNNLKKMSFTLQPNLDVEGRLFIDVFLMTWKDGLSVFNQISTLRRLAKLSFFQQILNSWGMIFICKTRDYQFQKNEKIPKLWKKQTSTDSLPLVDLSCFSFIQKTHTRFDANASNAIGSHMSWGSSTHILNEHKQDRKIISEKWLAYRSVFHPELLSHFWRYWMQCGWILWWFYNLLKFFSCLKMVVPIECHTYYSGHHYASVYIYYPNAIIPRLLLLWIYFILILSWLSYLLLVFMVCVLLITLCLLSLHCFLKESI